MTTPNTGTGTLQIPNDVLQPIINAHVAGAIAAALGERTRLIEEAVRFALETKVDGDGKHSNYTNSSSPTFLQWLVRDAIRKAAAEAVREIIGQDVEKIKELVSREIRNQRSPITKSLIASMSKSLTEGARYSIRVSVDGVER